MCMHASEHTLHTREHTGTPSPGCAVGPQGARASMGWGAECALGGPGHTVQGWPGGHEGVLDLPRGCTEQPVLAVMGWEGTNGPD